MFNRAVSSDIPHPGEPSPKKLPFQNQKAISENTGTGPLRLDCSPEKNQNKNPRTAEDNLLDGSSLTSKDPVVTAKAKVQHLCSIQKWPANMKVAEMLGGPFNKAGGSPGLLGGSLKFLGLWMMQCCLDKEVLGTMEDLEGGDKIEREKTHQACHHTIMGFLLLLDGVFCLGVQISWYFLVFSCFAALL